MIVDLYAKTDTGRVRRDNQDNLLLLDLSTQRTWAVHDDGEAPPVEMHRFEIGERGLVLVVSDGMGGALAGDVASRMAVDTVRKILTEGDPQATEPQADDAATLTESLHRATIYANLTIHHCSQEDPKYSGMGATFTGAAIVGAALGLVQVGDSRAYLLRHGDIKLVTKDQSLVQQLIDAKRISEEEAETHMFRNVILQALGAQSELTPTTAFVRLRRGDMLLLCSDGLSGKLRADDMRHIVLEAGNDLATACEQLIAEANGRGGEDNITVVLARFDGDDLQPPTSNDVTLEIPATSGVYTDDDEPTLNDADSISRLRP